MCSVGIGMVTYEVVDISEDNRVLLAVDGIEGQRWPGGWP